MKAIISLVDANISIVALCNERKRVLKILLEALDQYAVCSLSPDEYDDYRRTKEILIDRHSQHENT